MSIIKGDFLGFTFDGIHSSELGIFRVSDGSRYTENLLPTIQDKTMQIPGADGTFFQGSYYTQKQFNFPIAFDNLTEEQFKGLKRIFGDKGIHSLIFDEAPYKVYKVKAQGTPNLKYVCFDRPNQDYFRLNENSLILKTKESLYSNFAKPNAGRIYKGEGQLSFIAYNPFAKSRFKYSDEYTVQNLKEWGSLDTNYANDVYHNLYDWVESNKMIRSTAKKKINGKNYIIDHCTETGVLVYNPGDLPTHFILRFYFYGKFPNCIIGNPNDNFLSIKTFELYSGDAGVQINSKLNLIEGINSKGEVTGTVYNKYLIGGDFFKIPILEEPTLIPIYFNEEPNQNAEDKFRDFRGEIDYHYLYY